MFESNKQTVIFGLHLCKFASSLAVDYQCVAFGDMLLERHNSITLARHKVDDGIAQSKGRGERAHFLGTVKAVTYFVVEA